MGQFQSSIENKLTSAFTPAHLEVVNESHGHNVAKGSETHFKVTIASDVFEGMNLVKRHQKVYGVLAEELASGVHALALHTYTEVEWAERASSPDSPACMGGSRK